MIGVWVLLPLLLFPLLVLPMETRPLPLLVLLPLLKKYTEVLVVLARCYQEALLKLLVGRWTVLSLMLVRSQD